MSLKRVSLTDKWLKPQKLRNKETEKCKKKTRVFIWRWLICKNRHWTTCKSGNIFCPSCTTTSGLELLTYQCKEVLVLVSHLGWKDFHKWVNSSRWRKKSLSKTWHHLPSTHAAFFFLHRYLDEILVQTTSPSVAVEENSRARVCSAELDNYCLRIGRQIGRFRPLLSCKNTDRVVLHCLQMIYTSQKHSQVNRSEAKVITDNCWHNMDNNSTQTPAQFDWIKVKASLNSYLPLVLTTLQILHRALAIHSALITSVCKQPKS